MKRLLWVFIGLAVMGSAGCASAPSAPPTVDVTGNWQGTWSSAHGAGPITMSLKQTGSQYSGDLTMSGELVPRSGATQGVVSGNEMRLVEPSDLGGYLTVQGDEMTGVLRAQEDSKVTLRRQK